jgi:serine/threonine protein kinase
MAKGQPRKFGKCTLVKPLGRGATAVVYLAKHEGLGMPVAVKVLRGSVSRTRPEYAVRFLREARMAAWLDHPNIVRVIDCGIQDGYYYMVMDYVDGPNCLQRLQENEGGMDWRETSNIIRQAADGLAYAAGRDVIHRDVKPSNIMIDSSGRARVTDLGLAKLTVKGMAELTQELQTVGTPNYMSPEQIRSPSDLDLRADMYSLGASFYHMVTGRPPFIGRNQMDVVAQHLTRTVEPPYTLKRDLPPQLSAIICKMMAKSAEDRYQNYESLHADLDGVLEGKAVAAEGFVESHLDDKEDEQLARLLVRLGSGRPVEIFDEESDDAPPRPTTQSEAAPAPVSPLDPFEPAELKTYKAPAHEDSTVLVPKRKEKPKDRTYWFLAALAVLGLIAIYVVYRLTSEH